MKKHPINAQLPCHRNNVVVTGRKSKQNERPRIHHCKDCGQVYYVSVSNDRVLSISK
jgi:hypothetical protein